MTARAYLLDEAVPLLTLTGPGGVGKTRLALAIAQDVAGHFADDAVWVDLAPLADATLVPAAIAAALGVTSPPDGSLVADLGRAMRPRQTLLLLDNCEHVLAATADLVGSLLTQCPALQVLATSRARLHLHGEQLLPVEPLPLPADAGALPDVERNDAVQLFTERARAVRPAFALTESNAATVAALCRQLDGLPLAIELAAARGVILSPEALLAQMSNRLKMLTRGVHNLPPRQQTIAATITWSYDLLDPDQQELFRRLAVFAGGCTLEAIAAVAGGDWFHVLEGIEALRQQSLLRTVEGADGNDRYAMLETVHEFAWERLDERGEVAAARDAHAAFFLALAEAGESGVTGPDEADWNARLETEYPNLRAALAWLCGRGDAEQAWRLAGALLPYWQMRNDFSEGFRRLEEALALPVTTHTAAWAKAQTALGYMTLSSDDLIRARALLEEALAVWRELGDQRGIAMALGHLASVDWSEGDLDRARAQGEQSLATFRALGDDYETALALQLLGAVSLASGDYPRARAELEAGLQLLDGRSSVARSALESVLAWLSLAVGDERRAAEVWEKLLATCRARGYEIAIAVYQDCLGWLALRQGDSTRAAGCFAEELALGAKLGVEYDWARGLLGLAIVSIETGQAARAAWLFGASETAASGEDVIDGDRLHPIREPYERAVAATRRALGEEAFAAAWRAGGDLPRQQAVVRALADAAEPGAEPEGVVAAFDRLTRRETEVLRLLVQRWTDNEIAETLYISPRTASHHVSRIFSKLGVANRREAGAVAARLGLV